MLQGYARAISEWAFRGVRVVLMVPRKARKTACTEWRGRGIAPFGQAVQIVLIGPAGVAHSGLPMGIDADIPHLCCFHLRHYEAAEECGRKTGQAVDANGLLSAYPRKAIAHQLGCDDQTVRNVIHEFNATGLSVLQEGSSRPIGCIPASRRMG